MSYQKAYGRINWENYPSDKTPLNEANLNKIDYAVNEVDNRVLELDVKKLDLAVANGMVKSLTYNQGNGVFTITYLNGSSDTIDTKLEKLAVNFSYDQTAQQLIITLDDGTTQKVDMSALITQYEFSDTDTVAFAADGGGKVSANVKNGSITEDKLQPNYLADIKVQAANAQNSATAANDFAVKAESWAHGGTGTREDEDTDNSEYYFNQSKKIYDDFQTLGNVTGVKGAAETEYRHGNVDITPENIGLGKVPNVATNDQTPTFTEAAVRENITSGEKLSTLFGKIRKWFSDLKTVAFSGSYNDLNDKPSIPSVGNGTITITQNGATKGSFTTNQSGNATIALTDTNTQTVTGVKGNAESSYRTGNVNLTPANIGALPSSYVVYGNTTTVAGYALDARQANPNISGSLQSQINVANTALTAHKTSGDHDGRYYTETEVKQLFNSFLSVATKQSSDHTLNPGGTATMTVSCAVSGYTPIGIIGFNCSGTSESYCNIYRCILSGTTCTMQVKNMHQSNEAVVKANFYVLYRKNM